MAPRHQPKIFNGRRLTYLAHGSEEEAKHDERDVVRRERDDDSEDEHRVLAGEVDRLSTESVCHRREDDGADHHAEVEHRLRRLHQVVLVAYQVPLPSHADTGTPVQVYTRRPASADRTARAANFRRDLEAT